MDSGAKMEFPKPGSVGVTIAPSGFVMNLSKRSVAAEAGVHDP